jgi:hypothetical protein
MAGEMAWGRVRWQPESLRTQWISQPQVLGRYMVIEGWWGSITPEAIAEAVRLARQALLEHAAEYVVGPTAA